MPYPVFVFHGAGEPRLRDGEVYWRPLLERGLGPDYRIHAPRMPDPEDPHHDPWAAKIESLIGTADRPLLVGHSFGASTLLKHLARVAKRPALRGVFLVATPFWGRDFPEYRLEARDIAALQDLSPLYLYQSRDDEQLGADHLSKFAKAFPHSTIRELDGRGHEFDQDEFPELVADIRRCT